MSAISETYNRGLNIWELSDIYQMFFFSKQMKRNVIITNKNDKYELTDEFPNNVRVKKISKMHQTIVLCQFFFLK